MPRSTLKVDLITAEEVAELFRVDPRTVTRWARGGKIPFIKAGGHYRFRRAEIMAIIDKGVAP